MGRLGINTTWWAMHVKSRYDHTVILCRKKPRSTDRMTIEVAVLTVLAAKRNSRNKVAISVARMAESSNSKL